MAFPSSSGSKQENLAQAWYAARGAASTVKQRSQQLYDLSLAGNVSASSILDYATVLADMKARLSTIAAIPGITAYAQAQVGDGTLDVAAEYTAMASAIDDTVSWIIANFPKDASSYLQEKQFSGDNSGRTTQRQLSSAQTAGLRTQLSALIATID